MEAPIPSVPDTPRIPPRNENRPSAIYEAMVSNLTMLDSRSESEYSSPETTPCVPTTAGKIFAQAGPSNVPSSTTTTTTSLSSPPSASSQPPATTSTPAFDLSQKKEQGVEEAEKKAWVARYTEAQPTRMLLKTTDPEYAQIMRAWRVEQKRLGVEKKKELAAVVENGDGGKKKKEKKGKWWHF